MSQPTRPADHTRTDVNGNPNRVPPHDLDAEKALLGAALVDAELVGPVLDTLDGSHVFYSPAHQHICAAIQTLRGRGTPVTPVIVKGELATAGLLDTIGGPQTLTRLLAEAEVPGAAHKHAQTITEHHESRSLAAAAGQAHNLAMDGNHEEAARLLDEARDQRTTGRGGLREALLDTKALRDLQPPSYLVSNYLVQDSLSVLYGPSDAGKTFVALDLACHIATGSYWHGHAVTTSPVLYIIAEGAAGISDRLDAWSRHNRVYQLDDRPMHWLPQAVNLTDQTEVDDLTALCRDTRPGLVVLDTLARCMVGADENSSRDMGEVVASLDRIRTAAGSCVLAVHHTGKDGANGARGSSALRAALQTELEATAVDHRLVLRATKQKDGPKPHPLRLDRILVPGTGSCALVPAGHTVDDGTLSPGAMATLDTLRSIEVPGGISPTVWEDASDAGRSSFYNHRKRLLDLGLIRNVGTDKQPRYQTADDTQEEA